MNIIKDSMKTTKKLNLIVKILKIKLIYAYYHKPLFPSITVCSYDDSETVESDSMSNLGVGMTNTPFVLAWNLMLNRSGGREQERKYWVELDETLTHVHFIKYTEVINLALSPDVTNNKNQLKRSWIPLNKYEEQNCFYLWTHFII